MANWTHDYTFNEVEFAACLLTAGPPDHISRGGLGRADYCPVSTQEYRNKCREWYNGYLGLPCTQREFEEWWLAYKTWILEHRRD